MMLSAKDPSSSLYEPLDAAPCSEEFFVLLPCCVTVYSEKALKARLTAAAAATRITGRAALDITPVDTAAGVVTRAGIVLPMRVMAPMLASPDGLFNDAADQARPAPERGVGQRYGAAK